METIHWATYLKGWFSGFYFINANFSKQNLLLMSENQSNNNSDEKFEKEGQVTEVLPDNKFRVEIDINDGTQKLLCHLSGKMKMNNIDIIRGDQVRVEISPYDTSRGIINYRLDN